MHRTLESLSALLGPRGFCRDDDVLSRHSGDASRVPRHAPVAVLRPVSTAEVSAALAICYAAGLAVVPQGGLTGLSGGAVPGAGQVALSTERMNRIEEIDEQNAQMTVQAGVLLAAVQKRAVQSDLMFPVDIGARGSCTIGGMVATNAGGYRVLRHGMMRQNVLGLEVVLADGKVLDGLGRLLKDNTGFDLNQLFIGSEGCIGIVTRANLKLVPSPREAAAALLGVRDFSAAMDCLTSARSALGMDLSAVEGIWPEYWDMMTWALPDVSVPLAGRHGMYVLIECQGVTHVADRLVEWLETASGDGLIEDAVVATSQTRIDGLWSVREAIDRFWPIAVKERYLSLDIGLPVQAMGEFVESCRAALTAVAGCRALYFGHIGDGNLHVAVTVPDGTDACAEKIEAAIYGIVSSMSGAVTAEHGVGLLKKRWVHLTRSNAEIETMARLRNALDPRGILNPGKVVVPLKGGRH